MANAPTITEEQFFKENGVADILFAEKYTNGTYYTPNNYNTKNYEPIE
jgi:hypothetical protein